jgi:hypothetical protein
MSYGENGGEKRPFAIDGAGQSGGDAVRSRANPQSVR